MPAHAQDAQPERREPTGQETASFTAFYRSTPAQPSAAVFDIVRKSRKDAWRVEAIVDGAPYRAAGALCRMTQQRYAYNARAAADQRWSMAAGKRFAWLDRATCGRPGRLVELKQRIPDADLAPLIGQHGVLLLRARLLFAGNTSCAPHRSLRFRLAAIDVSAPPHGREELHALVFDSDRTARAQVWIKKRGAELNAWDVACSDATPAAR
ncbi:hypothetical protein HHL21_00940 [Massilia sp. RP-1-19]|uniref:Uncharacterized protein n=1 Tax=Massilia polaris TaxID=2728846 RepID=A0A848HHN5_9BURK|nr:hypothetical protein [Massilia polaris]NML59679.1 hypothetical protein [Massilia polaris]